MQTPTVSLLVALVLTAIGTAQRGVHVDEELGIKIRVPSKWAYLGGQGDRGSLRAMYCAPRAFSPKTERGEHTPTLRVLWFPRQDAKEAAAQKDGSDIPRKTPYTSFADYLARVYGPTTEKKSVEATAFGKIAGRLYVAEVPRNSASLTLHSCVIQRPEGELVFEFEVLSEQYKKIQKQFDKSAGSIAVVKPVQRESIETPAWAKGRDAFKEWSGKPAKDRATVREDWGNRWLKARKTRPEPGWKKQMVGPYLVLSRTDTRFTKRIVQATKTIHAWAEKRFAKVSDEAVMPAVLRIYNDQRERTAYWSRRNDPREYEPATREIHFYKDPSFGNSGGGFGPLIAGIFQQIVFDKHPLIYVNIPRWLDTGFGHYIESSLVKGKGLTFFPGDTEMGRFEYRRKHNNMPWLWDLIQEQIAPSPKDGSVEPRWDYVTECSRLIRWFDAGGSKLFNKTDFLPDYLAQIGASALAAPPNPQADVDWAFIEDDSTGADVRKKYYAWRDDLLQKINYTVIPLSVSAWKTADAAFKKFNAEFKR